MKISFSDTIFEKSNTDGISPDVKIAFTNAILERNLRTADVISDLSKQYLSILDSKGIEEANKFYETKIKSLPPVDKRAIDTEIQRLNKPSSSTNDPSSKDSATTGLVDKMKEISNRPGGAEELAKTQEQRYKTIKNL
jgi:hypothetical protein